MIRRIEALNYRSLRYIAQPINDFQVLVGPNASGKSSFLDVIVFLGDLLRVGPTRAILGDLRAGVPQRAPDPRYLVWLGQKDRFELAIELAIPEERSRLLPKEVNGKPLPEGGFATCRYEVVIGIASAGEIELLDERLSLRTTQSYRPVQRELFPSPPSPPKSILAPRRSRGSQQMTIVRKVADSGNDNYYSEVKGWNLTFRIGPSRSALANLPDDETKFPVATWLKQVLMNGVQRLTLSSEAMRRPCPPGGPRTLLPDGSNLPWVIATLKDKNPKALEQWIEHLRTAIPDLKSVQTVEREEDRHRYLVVEYENGFKTPSWVISDGTLRLLALTLLAYAPGVQDGIYLIEEPENGIHPRAVETVFQSLSSVYGAQILCATHSPQIVAMSKAEDILCFARDREGATDIVRGPEHPQMRRWRGEVDLGTYFASGVLG